MRFTRTLPVLLAVVSCLASMGGANAQGWYSQAWSYRKPLTIDPTKVGAGGVTNFPVLISHADVDLQAKAQVSGNDILFTSSDGTTKLSHEVERYVSATGALVAWVKVPSVSAAVATTVYMYYGNACAPDQQDKPGTWDANFAGVWHLPDGTTLTANDSTSNGNNGTITAATATAGTVDGAGNFDGVSGKVNVGHAASLKLTGTPNMTVEGWAKRVSGTAPFSIFTNGKGGGAGNITFAMDVGIGCGTGGVMKMSKFDDVNICLGGVPEDTNWHHYVGTWSTTGVRLYVDGALVFTHPNTDNIVVETWPQDVFIGWEATENQYSNGKIDEVRLSNTVRSASWVATEYNNQNTPSTFYAVGTEAAANAVAQVSFRSASAATGLPSPLTIAKPACTAQNDVMIASIAASPNFASGTADVGITPPAGWTLVRRLDDTVGNTQNSLAVYWKAAGAAEPGTYQWTFTCTGTCTSFGNTVGGIQSFIGVDILSPIDVENGAVTATGTSHSTPSVTTTVDQAMLVTSFAYASSFVWVKPAGETEAFQVSSVAPPSNAGVSVEGSYVIKPTAGATGVKTATSGDADEGNAHILALRQGTPAGAKLAFTVQPASTQAGASIAPAVVVEVQDVFGNKLGGSSAAVTLAIGTNPATGTLSGTVTKNAVAGVATFSNLSIDKAGAGYTLTAAAAGLTGATSNSFNITAGAANKLAFTVQPSDTTAGLSIGPAVVVTVQDALGNTVTSSSASISLGIGANPSLGTLFGTNPKSAVAGVATFSDLAIDKAGPGYTLTAASGVLTGATSTGFNITVGAASQVAFTVQPSNSAAGASLAPAVQVTVQDSQGNTVTSSSASVTVAFGANPGGGTLSGTLTQSAVAGVVTFAGLSINKAASGYSLAATSASLTGATSASFNISAGTATQLAFTVQPATTTAGAALTPSVTVQDVFGNTVTSSVASITVAIGTNPSGGALSGTNPKSAVAGVASFANLSIDKAGSGYTLTASSGALTGATSVTFDITPGAATQLAFTVQPTATTAGLSIGPAVVVTVQDALGNTVTSSAASITLAIGFNPGGGVLSGTNPKSAVAGIATFSNLSIDRSGIGYTLTASGTSLTGATSSSFDIAVGAANKLAFTVAPSNTTAGASVAPAVAVTVQDAFGNKVTSSADTVTLAIGSNPGGGTLSGTASLAASAGVATFSNLSIDKVGTGYSLTASSGVLTGATSPAFDIVVGAAAKLSFTTGPSTAVAGASVAPAVVVTVQDAFGNTVTSSSASIALAFGANPGGGALSGTNPKSAVAGVATFSDLNVDKTGVGYTLAASSASLTGATSGTFDVVPGAASKLAFTVAPTTAVAGASVAPAVVVTVQDALGNTVTSSSASIALAIGANPGSGALSGTNPKSAVAGVATFSNLSIDKAGVGYTLDASSGALTGATSGAFNILPGAAAKLAFTTQPATATAGAALTPTVTVEDVLGNTITSSVASVAIAIGANPGSGTLSGTTPKSAVAGVAAFANLSVDKAGVGYTLTATSAGLAGATSVAFNINAGIATQLAFTVQPLGTTAGGTLTPTVSVQDALGNTVPTATPAITVAIGANPGGGVLSGTNPKSAVAGVASFADLAIDKTGTGYTLVASAAGLTGATSATFDITVLAASKVVFTVQPTSASAGAAMAPAVVVEVQDSFGNTVAGASTSITLAFGANPGGGTLGGTATVSAVNGVATFATLSVDKAGIGYTLTATAAGLTGATSTAFNVAGGAAARLAFTVGPTNAVAGSALAPAVVVAVEDAFGNAVASATDSITLGIGANPGAGTLSGVNPKSAVAGLASFSDLSIDKTGVGYTLTASSGALTGATSAVFNITVGAPAELAFVVQPTGASAGAAWLPSVTVAVQDALGNTDTSSTVSIAVVLGANPGGGTLSGTVAQAAVAGLATFPGLSLDKVGTGYTLAASSGGLTGAISAAFDIAPGVAARLAFMVQPTSSVAGTAVAPAVVVTVEDALGNTVTSSAAPVALAFGANPGAGTLSGTTPLVASGGVASFSDLSVDKAGTGYTLVATSAGLTAATSLAFDIAVAAPAKLVFTVQPASTSAGAALSPSVEVQDAFGNAVTSSSASVALAVGNNPGGGVLSGAATLAAAGGVAAFSGLSLDRAGAGYTLVASSAGLAGAASAAFDIVAGSPAQLAFGIQPSSAVAGAPMTSAVWVQDAFGNLVSGSTASITVALGNNPGSGVLSGTNPLNAVGGVAAYVDLSVDKAGTGYTLVAASSGLVGATSAAFDITAGAAAQLAFLTQPSSALAGVALSPSVQVAVLDALGNALPSSTDSIGLALANNPGGGTLSGGGASAAVGGVASFAGLTVDKVGVGYTLVATSGALSSATSTPFDISVAAVAKLAFVVQPSSLVTGGTLAPAVQVAVQDALGNTDTFSTASIAVALGNNPGGGLLGGVAAVNAVGGVATFAGLTLDKVGVGYTLVATSAGLPAETSAAFDVTAGPAAKLAFVLQPSGAVAGAALSASVQVQDAQGNAVTSSTAGVVLALGNNPGGGALSGVSSAGAVGGVAAFSGLSINRPGVGYTLTASSSGLTGATSAAFDITAGVAAQLAFVVNPVSTVAGATLTPAVAVAVQDSAGNTLAASTASVSIALLANPGNATLGGSGAVATVNGVATFADLSMDKSGVGYTLSASAPGLGAATSAAFDIAAGAPTRLAFVVQPATVEQGVPLSPAVRVAVQDAMGNSVPGASATITVLLLGNPGFATLAGTTSAATVDGVATFGDLALNREGSGYTLKASAAGMADVTSDGFDVFLGDVKAYSVGCGCSAAEARGAGAEWLLALAVLAKSLTGSSLRPRRRSGSWRSRT